MGSRVAIIRQDGQVLELNNDLAYQSDVIGLFDLPQPDIVSAQGYQSKNVFLSATAGPRQLVINVHILSGLYLGYSQSINPQHLAARDDLITFLPYGEEFTLRTEYPGTTGYWDIVCISLGVQWVVDTPDYICPCTCFDPTFIQTIEQTNHQHLSAVAQELNYNVIPPADKKGNFRTYPVIHITPTAAKADRWSRARVYTVNNPSTVNLQDYPIRLPFDFAWHITNGLMLPSGADLLAVVNNQVVDFWKGSFPNANGSIWVKLDIDAGATVTVRILYSNPEAEAYVPATLGPMLVLDSSLNTAWKWIGGFTDVPGLNTSRSEQWSIHAAQNQGLSPILSHQGAPWDQRIVNSVNVAGGYVPQAANIQGYAGLAVHHPIGFTQVIHSGRTMTDTARLKFVLRSRDPVTAALSDDWSQDTNTSGALTAYGIVTTVFSTVRDAIVFALRSLTVHDAIAGFIGAADEVTASISNPPVVTGAGSGSSNEETTYFLEFQIHNNNTGQYVYISGIVTLQAGSVWNSVILDTENQIVTMGGENFYPALSTNLPIRAEWLRMVAGLNNFYIIDPGTNGLDVDIFWHARRL